MEQKASDYENIDDMRNEMLSLRAEAARQQAEYQRQKRLDDAELRRKEELIESQKRKMLKDRKKIESDVTGFIFRYFQIEK